MKIRDKMVYQNLCSSGFGTGANIGCVDVMDGKIVRIYPQDVAKDYTPEELNLWKFEVRGHTFNPGLKSLLPPFNLAYKQRAYSPNRILYPMKRVDWDPAGERNPQNRGKSEFERISWDEALDIISDEIIRIRDTYGTRSILCQGEGHGETKAVAGAHGCMIPMLDCMNDHPGEYTVQARQPDSWEGWYWGAKHMWGGEPCGSQGVVDNVIWDVSKNSDAVIYWGCDLETTPWGWGGQMASRLAFWFDELEIMHIHIAPDCNYTNAVHADKWIPVLPNTDAALQLAIAYVWITEGTYDREYVETHTVGFDWFEYSVLGHGDGIPKTPEWAAEKCHVPSYRIKALARYWAKHAISIAHGNGGGYIRSVFSHEPARLEVALLAMQGLGKPGCNQFKFLEWNGLGDVNPLPRSKYVPFLVDAYHGGLAGPSRYQIPKTMTPRAIDEGRIEWYGDIWCACSRENQFEHREYPDGPEQIKIHMIWSDTPCYEACWNGGFSYQDAVRDPSIEFYLVQHPWMENDCHLADIILPVSTIFESDDIMNDFQNGQCVKVVLEDKAIEPLGESKNDYECCCAIAGALDAKGAEEWSILERYTKGRTVEDDRLAGYLSSGLPLDEYPVEELYERRYIAIGNKENWEDDPVGMGPFRDDPMAHPLQTPTGLIEFYSSALAENFPDDKIRAPYPQWVEESDEHQERIHSERAKEYPFLLVSNHPRWRVHAQHDDIPWTREIPTCKIQGKDGYWYEPIWVNPSDAEKLGLVAGDIAELYNERGRVLGAIYITERIMEGSLYQDHGARTDIIVPGTGGLDRGGSNNMIAPSATTSKNAAGEVTNGYLVGIRKVDIDELAQKYPDEFKREYDPLRGPMFAQSVMRKEQ